jgi:hypothetical protein
MLVVYGRLFLFLRFNLRRRTTATWLWWVIVLLRWGSPPVARFTAFCVPHRVANIAGASDARLICRIAVAWPAEDPRGAICARVSVSTDIHESESPHAPFADRPTPGPRPSRQSATRMRWGFMSKSSSCGDAVIAAVAVAFAVAGASWSL